MEKKYETLLQTIYEVAQKSNDLWALKVDIGRGKGDDARWLQNEGYISKLESFGKIYIKCQVTDKGKSYFEN